VPGRIGDGGHQLARPDRVERIPVLEVDQVQRRATDGVLALRHRQRRTDRRRCGGHGERRQRDRSYERHQLAPGRCSHDERPARSNTTQPPFMRARRGFGSLDI
jgi:hypothetical protein